MDVLRFLGLRPAAIPPPARPLVGPAAPGQAPMPGDALAVSDAYALTVARGKREEHWTPDGTAAMANGRPLEAPLAPRVPGERPRGAWVAHEDRFRYPAAEADAAGRDLSTYGAFAAKLDANEEAIGAHVLEPTNRAFNYADKTDYNCHSYGLTDAHGDAASPFTDPTTPRWVASPQFELTNGRWNRLAEDQRSHVGDRLIYRQGGAITHTAVITAVDDQGNPSRVQSKWGHWGLFEHDPFDVPNVAGTPSDYGQPAERYRPVR